MQRENPNDPRPSSRQDTSEVSRKRWWKRFMRAHGFAKFPPDQSTRYVSADLTPLHVWQPVEELVERDRIVSDAHAGRVVDRVGDGCADPADAQLADAFGLHRRRHRVGIVQKDHVLMRNIGMDRHFIAGKVMIYEEAE